MSVSFLLAARVRLVDATSWPSWPDSDTIRTRCATLPGAHVLDVDTHNIVIYACGVWELVERDVRHVLPPQASAAVLASLRKLRVPEAFALRNELCNMKKVAFYQMQQTNVLERQLAQLATFFHGEHVSVEAPGGATFWVHSSRLTALSDARMQAKGASAGLHDARALCKQCASMPRHPCKATPSFLEGLPATLHAWRLAKAAATMAGMTDDAWATDATCHAIRAALPLGSGVGAVGATSGEAAAESAPGGAVGRVDAASWHLRAQESLAAQGWPAHITSFVACVLIARGADKALRIRDAVAAADTALARTLAVLSEAQRRLETWPSVEEAVMLPPERPVAGTRSTGAIGGDGGWAGDGGGTGGGAESGRTDVGVSVGFDGGGSGCSGGGGVGSDTERASEDDGVGGSTSGDANNAAGDVSLDGASGEGDALWGHPELRRAMHRRRHLNLLGGCVPVLIDTLEWLRSAMAAAAEGRTVFVAGDCRGDGGLPRGGDRHRVEQRGGDQRGGGQRKGHSRELGWQPALFVATDGPQQALGLLSDLRVIERRHRPEMRALIAAHGWPPAIVARRGGERERPADNRQCRACERQFSALWVHRGICCECEAEVRAAGRCPYSDRCEPAWFCPHSRCCFVCDAHGCAACRLERGAAEAVAEVVERVRPVRICIDFDRTLANSATPGAKTIASRCLTHSSAPLPCPASSTRHAGARHLGSRGASHACGTRA